MNCLFGFAATVSIVPETHTENLDKIALEVWPVPVAVAAVATRWDEMRWDLFPLIPAIAAVCKLRQQLLLLLLLCPVIWAPFGFVYFFVTPSAILGLPTEVIYIPGPGSLSGLHSGAAQFTNQITNTPPKLLLMAAKTVQSQPQLRPLYIISTNSPIVDNNWFDWCFDGCCCCGSSLLIGCVSFLSFFWYLAASRSNYLSVYVYLSLFSLLALYLLSASAILCLTLFGLCF